MDELRDLATRSPNFGFLVQHEPLLGVYGARAEAYVFSDSNTALFKERQFVETLVRLLVQKTGIPANGNTLASRITALANGGALTSRIEDAFREVKDLGNAAVHADLYDSQRALASLRICYELGVWYHRAASNEDVIPAFIPPEPPITGTPDELAKLHEEIEEYQRQLTEANVRLDRGQSMKEAMAEAEARAREELAKVAAERDRLLALVQQLQPQESSIEQAFQQRMEHPVNVGAHQREAFIERARRPAPLTEAQVRVEIDAMLRAAGWMVQDVADLNAEAGLGVAVREYPLSTGRADYALYVNAKLVGVIEAKREGTTLSDVEPQSGRYASAVLPEDASAIWRSPLPFRYESTAVETYFTNGLDPDPRAREVFSFHQPTTVARWMREADQAAGPEQQTLRGRLRHLPDLEPTGLRYAQVEALHGLEKSLSEDRPRSLIQMATGAGKTYTAATFSYRMLKYAGAQRVLFLVDRNHLGEQTLMEFRNYDTPEENRKFPELYAAERLTGRQVLDSSKVVISTIQRMYRLLRGEALLSDEDEDAGAADVAEPADVAYNPAIPPETFDFIVVDECHRSIYGLWRGVLEYFDAYIVGLTATPTKQTLGFFHRNLVSEYSYERSVADGVNVDFDVFRIRTKLTEQGGTLDAGLVVPKRDRMTRRQWFEQLEDDYTYAGTQIGRSVVAVDQIRTVIQTFKDNLPSLFPGRTEVPKTLIFAKDDNHAEDIVKIVREVFGRGNAFAAKITYKSRAEGNDPADLLSALRTSAELRVAVTVDMIATGTDVRPLECVLFLRDVKSPVYFEQMKGRGARTINDTEFQQVTPDADSKDHFLIVDAVGVTEHEWVDAEPLQKHSERQISLEQLLRKTGTRTITADEVGTLASRLTRLNHDINEDERAELDRVAGRPLSEIRKELVDAVDPDILEVARQQGTEAVRDLVGRAIAPLADNPDLRQRILELRRAYDIVIDEINDDEVIEAKGVSREDVARQRVGDWHAYLAEHEDEIILQQIRQGRRGGPGMYAGLKDLAERVGRPPYVWTPAKLWEAYETLGKAVTKHGRINGPVELITLMRYELGLDAELKPYGDTIRERYTAWLLRQEQTGVHFTTNQKWWLDHIVDVIATDAVFEPTVLDQAPFTTYGGTDGFLAAFGDVQAEQLIHDLNEDLTA